MGTAMQNSLCEVCHRRATVSISDWRDGEPTTAEVVEEGEVVTRLFATLVPAGVHHFCEDHKRAPRRLENTQGA